MEYARSNMAIIDAPLVNIGIFIDPKYRDSRLQLNYQGQTYDLVQAFASHKLELAQQRWQQQIAIDASALDRYLLVQEVGYYSLWLVDRVVNLSSPSRESNGNLELQQASIWLVQEMWLQWQDLLGERQLKLFADNLLGANSLLRSREDLDRILSLDPLSSKQLAKWERSDFIALDRQLSDLTQKKMGQQFGNKLTLDILESMPDSLRKILTEILDPKIKLYIPQHD
jgi:hypothetical protein